MAYALTTTYYWWSWPRYGDGSCDLSAATVTYLIEVIFPRWIPPKDASPDLVADWERFTLAVAEHEKGHVDIVIANIQSIKNAIKGATCETAFSAAKAVVDHIDKLNEDYEITANRGIFP